MNNIRLMKIEDLHEVLRIESLSFDDAWSFYAFIRELFSNSKASYYVYHRKNKVIAYIGMWILNNEIHITNLAVDPIFRKNGIGTELIEYTIKKGIEFEKALISLEVRVSNNLAIKLYEKLGFKKIKKLKKYYINEDGIRMEFYL